MKTLMLLLATVGIVMAQDATSQPDPASPVSFPEIQSLYDALRVPWLTEKSKSSTFSFNTMIDGIKNGTGYDIQVNGHADVDRQARSDDRDWLATLPGIEKKTAQLLARPEGRNTRILKDLAELEHRIDARQDSGLYEFMTTLDQDYRFPTQ